jgi:hypothetical protein
MAGLLRPRDETRPIRKKGQHLEIQVLPFCFLATTEFIEFLLIPFRDIARDSLVWPIWKQADCETARKRDS